jgi:protein-tyrosine phosphatase
MRTDRIGVLFVCHANLCRSPMAERLARRAIADRLEPAGVEVDVSSAGTHAEPDLPIHPLAGAVLREYGADDTGFRSRRLTAGLVAEADLILTATRDQRAACVDLHPAAVRRTFTVRQFGRYASALPPVTSAPDEGHGRTVATRISQLSVVRSTLPVVPAEEDELFDPVRLPIEDFRRCAADIQRVVDIMTGLIAPI